MKKIILAIIILNLLYVTGLGGGPEPEKLTGADCKKILQEMSRKLSANESLQARFVQERHLVMFGDVLRSEGYFFYRKPGRVRWEFTKPYVSLTIMLESGEVEKFDVVKGRPVRVETGAKQVLAEVLNQISNWQRGDIDRAGEDFGIEMYRSETYKLVLNPLSKGLAKIISRIEFEINRQSFLAHSISLWEDENDYTQIRFYEQKVNEKISDELFDLKNPGILDIDNSK